jgi:3-hydroxybutyryl-CoA dehydrogenase
MWSFSKAGVVGAGTMGHGIAYVLAQAGLNVCLIDQSPLALDRGIGHINLLLDSGMQKDKLTSSQAELIRSRISSSSDLDALTNADLMIEAVNEDIELKRYIFSVADVLVNDDGLLATNTSSLSVASIARHVVLKERVLGLHFFNPPHIMKLLEIVVHDDTSNEAVEMAKALAQALRKECIVVNDSPGFATSRLGLSFALEAIRMLEQGVAGISEIDSAMKLGYGHPMGPLMLSDWVGLDVRLAISDGLHRSLNSQVFAPPDLLRRMVRAGFLGKKSGTGFYEWENGRHLGVSQALLDMGFGNI